MNSSQDSVWKTKAALPYGLQSPTKRAIFTLSLLTVHQSAVQFMSLQALTRDICTGSNTHTLIWCENSPTLFSANHTTSFILNPAEKMITPSQKECENRGMLLKGRCSWKGLHWCGVSGVPQQSYIKHSNFSHGIMQCKHILLHYLESNHPIIQSQHDSMWPEGMCLSQYRHWWPISAIPVDKWTAVTSAIAWTLAGTVM